MTNAVTTPTAPAPMSAERLKHIRDNYQRLGEAALERHCGELLAHIDALTARIAELEQRHVFTEQLADAFKIEVAKVMKLETELAAARKPPEDGMTPTLDDLVETALRAKYTGIDHVASLRGGRKAMSVVEAVARALWDHDKINSSPPEGDGWKLFVDEARAAIEALAANVTDEMLAVHEAFDGEPVTDTEPSPEVVKECRAYFARYPKQLLASRNAMAAALRAALSDGKKGGG